MATSATLWRDPALPPTQSHGSLVRPATSSPSLPSAARHALPCVGPQRLATLCPLPGTPYLLPAPPLVQFRHQLAQLQAARRAPPAST